MAGGYYSIVSDRAEADAAREKTNRAAREKLEARLRAHRAEYEQAKLLGTTHEWKNLGLKTQILHDEDLLRQFAAPPVPRDEWKPSPNTYFERRGGSHGQEVTLSSEQVADARARGISLQDYARGLLDEGMKVVVEESVDVIVRLED
jgi:hypothetical protein